MVACSQDVRALYFHWPFCPYRCSYCPFVALAGHEQFMTRYHTALHAEFKHWSMDNAGDDIRTIFFGGGTPSTYPDDKLLDTFGTIRDVVNSERLAEVTIEVNPGTVREQQFELWKSIGINRLSIGVQFAKEKVLRLLNRHHSEADIAYVLNKAPLFFENISVDLMLGLPGVTEQAWKSFVAEVVTWPITHVSLYCLMLHENTPLYFRVQKKDVKLPSDALTTRLYQWTVDFLSDHGIYQYEISNFARKGYESLHNLTYWDRQPYKGFGLAACSFDGTERTQNESNLMRYFSMVESEKEPIVFREILTANDERLEKIMLGLRRTSGVPFCFLIDGLQKDEQQKIRQKIDLFERRGLLVKRDGNIILTTAGFIVENELIAELAR